GRARRGSGRRGLGPEEGRRERKHHEKSGRPSAARFVHGIPFPEEHSTILRTAADAGGGMRSTRRRFLASGTAALAPPAGRRARGDWEASARYPDPAIKILDPSFLKYRVNSAKVERLFTGCRWSEGPVWFGDGRCLLWSDIPNDRILKWEEETGA